MLQNCMCLINNETHCGSEARLTALDKETVEGNIEFEEQNPVVITILPIQPEPEVSEWFLCISSNISCLQEHLLPQKEKFLKFTSTVLMYIPCIWFSSLSSRTIVQRIY